MGHTKHFIRLLSLLALAVVGFLFVRSKVVPKDFGKLGHFRAGAIEEAAAREPRHLGSAACADCHSEIVDAWSKGKHSTPQCETCHGPGFLHIKTISEESTDAYPDVIKKSPNALRVMSGIRECKWCHVKTFERPPALKYIDGVPQHITEMGGTYTVSSKCTDCHDPHTTVTK